MSNIFIRNVVGSGTFAVPVDDTALANATVGLAGVLSGVAGLAVGRVLAWVETTGAGGATRVLNCLAEGFVYNGEVCPDAVETANLGAAISAAFLGTPGITSIGDQNISIFSVPAGSPVTLQVAYNNSIVGVPEIVVDAARGAVSIEDNATPIDAELLTVRSNGGSQNYICVNDERTQFWDNVHSQGSARYQGDAKAIVEGSVTYHDIAYEGAAAFNFQADWSFDAAGAGITGMEVNAQTHPRVTNSCTGPLVGLIARAEHLASAKCDTMVAFSAEAGNWLGCGPGDRATAIEAKCTARARYLSSLFGMHGRNEIVDANVDYSTGILIEECLYSGAGRTLYNTGIAIAPMLNGKDGNVALLVGHTTPPTGHFNFYTRSNYPSAIMEWLGVGGDQPIANLDVNGSLALAEVHFGFTGTPYYIIATDQIFTVICDASLGQIDIYLPPASTSKGRVLCFKLNNGASANQMYIYGDHGEMIDGKDHYNTSFDFTSIIIQCDGRQWWIIAHNA